MAVPRPLAGRNLFWTVLAIDAAIIVAGLALAPVAAEAACAARPQDAPASPGCGMTAALQVLVASLLVVLLAAPIVLVLWRGRRAAASGTLAGIVAASLGAAAFLAFRMG